MVLGGFSETSKKLLQWVIIYVKLIFYGIGHSPKQRLKGGGYGRRDRFTSNNNLY